MAESADPPLRLTIEGLRWMGDEFKSMGADPATIDLADTDSGEEAAMVLRSLRKIAARRFDTFSFALALKRETLDFDAPNAPTEPDMNRLVDCAERVLAAARLLRELAPEAPDDEDDAEGDPEPSPEPAETA